MKSLTYEDTVYFWSCSILGAAKKVKPAGALYTSALLDLQSTISMCVRAVEGCPSYEKAGFLKLVNSEGFQELEEYLAAMNCKAELEQSLIEKPLYPIWKAEEAQTPRVHMTLKEAAVKLGVTAPALTKQLQRLQVALPYGSCYTTEGWKIFEEDLQEIYKKGLTDGEVVVECPLNRAS